MKTALLVFCAAAVFAATSALGVVQLGSGAPTPAPVVLSSGVRASTQVQQLTRTAVAHRVERGSLTRFGARP